MKDVNLTIKSNVCIAPSVYKMVLTGNTHHITAPGQFVNFKLDGLYLRRPISVCDYTDDSLTVIYKVVGEGTEQMSKMLPGESMMTLVGLGNGYDTTKSGQNPLLIGGGVGIPPMYNLAKKLISEGKLPQIILGFNKAEEIFYEDEFKALGCEVYVCTADAQSIRLQRPAVSSALRSVWVVALALVWVAHARQLQVIREFARTVPFWKERKSYGSRFENNTLRNRAF